ncbi:DUF2092 domain-containing protein [Cognataquiflexum aquatile]|uniref:DUF2092 domain-containing protein n=1 Tax=Cognataquiflexum aquatile TaxID=2249427 RepID=UPI000DEAA4E5|nr:DUF2092 domain-containing protein [Cognataquiflexum aquatile]
MQKIGYFMVAFFLVVGAKAQDSTMDARAVVLLDRMSEVIGDLKSCSFQLKTGIDVNDPGKGILRQYSVHDVHMVGPDKMHIHSKGPKEELGYWYNTDMLMYYSFTANTYGFIETPDNILETIDMVNADYGVDFPAGDFFYPSFTDDLIESSESIYYIGLVHFDGRDYHHIVAKGTDKHIQIWIHNDTFALPGRYVIHEKKDGETLQFEGTFSNWKLNPDLPVAIFDFVAPENARRLNIVSKSSTY